MAEQIRVLPVYFEKTFQRVLRFLRFLREIVELSKILSFGKQKKSRFVLYFSYLFIILARFNTQNDAKRKIIYEKATKYAASMASETVTRCCFRFI